MKRLFDIIASFLGLLLLFPVLLVVFISVILDMGTPVFFRQERAGKNGVSFYLIKFRTMNNDTGDDGELLPDHERITSLGNFLRKTSLDELPALINVLKGDMSVVGPRPLLVRYLPLYNEFQARRHEVKPGITGWAQVNGRNSISWEDKFILDVWYVDNQSYFLDIKILVMTIFKVIKRDGIAANDHATMPEFLGTNSGNDEK